MAFLEIDKFNKTFNDGFQVLNDISFSLKKGEVLSIIGSSGSGKTTLLRAINFLTDLDSGKMVLDDEVLYDGEVDKNTNDNKLREKRLNFGLVFQQFNLFPQYTVLRNITLAPELLLKEKIKKYKTELKIAGKSFKERLILVSEFKKQAVAEIEKNGLEILEKVGLLEKSNAYPCDLSGGQQQRVAIARALALNPKVLCFDEPTSALDPELTGEVLKVIRSLKGKDRTMIIVTHEMDFAKNVSDKVLFMTEGVVEEIGTAKQIFENPKSDKLKAFLSHAVENKVGE
ncbi:MAG: amino acid ABC transporter ATP-binding protein [Clostridiales bacterium]|nr:amino acid ABC transporter ATP-binding protein [Clostridiales bacterium]